MEPNVVGINLENVYVPSDQVVAREIEGELIIVPLEAGVADFNDTLYSLNETGRSMWGKLGEGISLGTICMQLAEEYNASLETIEADIFALIQKLSELKIVKKI